jgi:hypothetical protein
MPEGWFFLDGHLIASEYDSDFQVGFWYGYNAKREHRP